MELINSIRDFIAEAIATHPTGYGAVLAWIAAALLAVLVVKKLVGRVRGESDPAIRVFRKFIGCRLKGDLQGLSRTVASMKFDAKGRVDEWFTRMSIDRLGEMQKDVEVLKIVGKEPRLMKDGAALGGMITLKLKVKSKKRGTYDGMVWLGKRPVAPFDGEWRILVQDFVGRVGPYEGPTAIYTYKKPKLACAGEGLAQVWRAHAKHISVQLTDGRPGRKAPPPPAGPLREPSPLKRHDPPDKGMKF